MLSGVRSNFILEIRIVGKLALLVAWRRLDVIYSSSWLGMNTQASWKNGLFVFPAVDMRRE